MGDGVLGRLLPALAVALGGCSLVLDFEGQDGGASGPADAGFGDAGVVCLSFEPNDDVAAAVTVEPDTHEAASCGADDVDYFAFAVAEGDDVVVELSFDGPKDLDLELVDIATGAVISVSTGSSQLERLEHSAELDNALAAGTYALAVRAHSGTGDTPYSLSLSVAPPAAAR